MAKKDDGTVAVRVGKAHREKLALLVGYENCPDEPGGKPREDNTQSSVMRHALDLLFVQYAKDADFRVYCAEKGWKL